MAAPSASAVSCEEIDPNLDSLWLAHRTGDHHIIGGYDPNVECWPVSFDDPWRIDIGP